MAEVYTELFYGGVANGLAVLGGPPEGFRWVVVDVEWSLNIEELTFPVDARGVSLYIPEIDGFGLFAAFLIPRLDIYYETAVRQWTGRVAVDYPNHLAVFHGSPAAHVLVTGYQLSLP